MKKIIFLLVITGGLLCGEVKAQENQNNFGIKFSGYVKSDFFFDSRKTVSAREGHFLLWPEAENLDVNGNDINAKSSFNFLAIQSRLKGTITGPDAFGAKTSGAIEGDFFAQANDNINMFRLRHAFVKLNWTNTEIIAGQYWSPLFVTSCFPNTIAFSAGVPIQSFSRNPQLRLTQTIGNLSVIVAALSQRDYTSRGPDGASSDYLRNSMLPDFHFQLHYNSNNLESATKIVAGAGVAYKKLVPRLTSEMALNTFKIDESVSSMTAIAFVKATSSKVTVKMQGRYGENNSDVLAISGFAVKDIEDTETGARSYTPLKNASFWSDIHSNGSKMQIGLFAGVTKNLGTKEEMSDVANDVYMFGGNVEKVMRFSPRIEFISNKTKIGCEIEYTSATYGSGYDTNYIPDETSTVANVRMLLGLLYAF